MVRAGDGALAGDGAGTRVRAGACAAAVSGSVELLKLDLDQ